MLFLGWRKNCLHRNDYNALSKSVYSISEIVKRQE